VESIGTRRRELEPQAGFTLIEMMVALIIIAVLVAIAIPTFLAARERSSNRAAQARANTALKAHKTDAADGKPLPGDLTRILEDLREMEPAITYAPLEAHTEVKGAVYVRPEDVDGEPGYDRLTMVAGSTISGECFWTRDAGGLTTYAKTMCTDTPDDDDWVASPPW
jgi:type IV pilus assembly protein PilA